MNAVDACTQQCAGGTVRLGEAPDRHRMVTNLTEKTGSMIAAQELTQEGWNGSERSFGGDCSGEKKQPSVRHGMLASVIIFDEGSLGETTYTRSAANG